MKIGVIGCGQVGAASAYACVLRGVGTELVLVDRNHDLAVAQAEDILHATPFAAPILVRAGDFADLAGAGIVMIAAGAAQKPGETRLDLLKRNADIFADMIPKILDAAPDAILLIASNPVDVMTHMVSSIAARTHGIPPERVIGSDPVLDREHVEERRLVIGAAAHGQAPGVDPKTCLPELVKCVEQYGNVAINLNPDPSGGHWKEPPLTDRWWYPLYEKMVELDVPAMVHVSTSCNPCFHATGAHYINADTTAFMQFLTSDLFRDFPTLKFIIPHGGGAVPYHWGRYKGIAQDMKRPPLRELLLNNVFFDTCVYHYPGIELLAKVMPVDNILFASEMVGAVRGIDPDTGHHYDDTKRYVDQLAALSEADRSKIFEGNARRVFGRLGTRTAREVNRVR